MLYTILLFQAGGFALQYLSDGNQVVIDPDTDEVVVVNIPINLPYQPDWVAPVEIERTVRQGDEYNQVYESNAVSSDQNAREIFLSLAEQMNKNLNEQTDSNPSKAKLINILIKEYCAQSSGWVFYILDWPTAKEAISHPILPTQDFSSALFSPPRQA